MNKCKHCNAELFPDCQCLTSSNNHSDSATGTIFYVFICCCTQSKWIDLIKYRYYSGKCQIIKCLCYVLHR